jgi:hypothetical protein
MENNAADPGTQAHGTTKNQAVAPGTQPHGTTENQVVAPGTQPPGLKENNDEESGTQPPLAPPYVYANRVVDTEEGSADSVNQKEKVPSTPEKRKATNQVPGVPSSTESQKRASARITKLAAEAKDTLLETVPEEGKGQKRPKTNKRKNT